MYKTQHFCEKADVETFVITECNRAQTALYNWKLSSFKFSCHRLPSHLFLGSISSWQSQIILKLCAVWLHLQTLSVSFSFI